MTMKLMISKCLLGYACKYNGGDNYHEELVNMIQNDVVIPFCPEVLGGLATPRVPSEIRKGRVINKDGIDVHNAFLRGAKQSVMIAEKEQPDLIILQSRSPSCGVGTVYDGTFTGRLIDGDGITVSLLKQHGFQVIDVEEFVNRKGNIK